MRHRKPTAGNCTTTRPNCYANTNAPHPQEFDDDEPCTRSFTLDLTVVKPGGCSN